MHVKVFFRWRAKMKHCIIYHCLISENMSLHNFLLFHLRISKTCEKTLASCFITGSKPRNRWKHSACGLVLSSVSRCLEPVMKHEARVFDILLNNERHKKSLVPPFLTILPYYTQSWNWNNHINNITTKANRSLGFIKRNLKRCPEQIKDQAYKSPVRPHVEYASSVWSPHQKYQVDKLEKVQRKAARFVKNCWIREEGVMTNMLSKC